LASVRCDVCDGNGGRSDDEEGAEEITGKGKSKWMTQVEYEVNMRKKRKR
jgi:hypothetical protein